MDIYSKLVKHIVHPLWMIKDRKTKLFRYLQEFERNQYMSAEQIQEKQLRMLTRLVRYSYENCAFYRRALQKHGIRPSDIQDFSDYQKIPFLTKHDIQIHLADLVSKQYRVSDLVVNKTGGSTGKPIRYYHDKDRMISMEASTIRHNRWAGYDIGDKAAVIWGHRHDWSREKEMKWRLRNLLLSRWKFLDASSITEEKLEEFVAELRKFKPKIILAYASAMYLFAQYCRDQGICDIRPTSIITSAEVLHEEARQLIESVFQCKVFDRYGCREVSVIASECDRHMGLHINSDSLYIEIVDDYGRPSQAGQIGDIVITDLRNYGMPFIRYKIEDMGVFLSTECTCGRGLPLLGRIEGRTTDFIITPSGRKVSGAALTIFLLTNIPGIKQGQIVQDRVDHVKFKIVPTDTFNEDSKAFLQKEIQRFLGVEMQSDIIIVDKIPRVSSGKFRFSICEISPKKNEN